MPLDPRLLQTFVGAARRTTVFMIAMGLVSATTGFGVLAAGIFLPARKDELAAKVVVLLMGAGMVVGGIALGWVFQRRTSRLRALIERHPARIAKVEVVEIKRRAVRIWAVWVTDTAGQRLGAPLANEPTARQVAAGLQALQQEARPARAG